MNTPQFDLSAMLSTPQQTAVQQILCNKLHHTTTTSLSCTPVRDLKIW